jgi:allantoinase
VRRALRSTRVVTPDAVGPATVVLDGGRIEAVESFGVELGGGAGEPLELVELGDFVLAPGLVDCHVHVNEPGRTEWEGFETATRAAAAGGITALVDMPLNCIPVTTSGAAFATKLAASAGHYFVDVGFWGGVIPGNELELSALADGGVLGCKAFLVDSGIDEFPRSTAADLRRSMPILRDAGLPLLAHAELDLGDPAPKEDPRAYRTYLASRPAAWEDAAIALLIELCRETRCAVHIVHLSSAASVPALRRAKEEGLPITVETCPHYLCLEAESIPDGATHYKCAPPIREHDNREGLWRALFEGVIDFVISDHSPCTPALKLPERGDFQDAWGGIASLGLGLPAVWTEARRRGATVLQITRWMSAAPARFAGLQAKKGAITRGRDADFVVWDPEQRFPVLAESLFFRHRISPYVGSELRGKVRETWLGGQRVFDGSGHSVEALGKPLLHRNQSA